VPVLTRAPPLQPLVRPPRLRTLAGFARLAGLFLPAFIAWQGFSLYADRFDTDDDLVFRTVMLLGMLAIAALAVQIPDVVQGTAPALSSRMSFSAR
jgi:low temperature requirement protein LtrA